MMLRSSSTPLLGSLLSESPNNHHHHHQSEFTNNLTPPKSINHGFNKISCSHGVGQNFTKISYTSNSPCISPSVSEPNYGRSLASNNGFRRTRSEGNLEGLANVANETVDEFSLSKPAKKPVRKPHGPFLETIPSFSFRNSTDDDEVEDEDYDIDYMSEQYSVDYNGIKGVMSCVSQNSMLEMIQGREEMYLARGLGVGDFGCLYDGGVFGGCGVGGGGYRPVVFDRDSGDSQGLHVEEHYKRMLEENPGNPLFLRNYAQFLYQTKKDLKGAEEYYSRAILADPSDGEVLSQYAKLVWELHRDTDRANSYFKRALQATSDDSHIQAAYASFLWETEDENDDTKVPPPMHNGAMAAAIV